jgi:RHS repeat-associated protein
VDGEMRQHSSFNEITERKGNVGITVLHDNNGNQTDDGTFMFGWDSRNRLRTVTRKEGNVPIAAYAYDALGRRVRKVVTNSGALNGTTDFYLSGWREIEERNTDDVLTQQYVFGVYIDEPLVLDRNRDGNDTATSTNDQRLFYHQNTMYSVFALTDTTGRILEGYQYDAYGRQTVFGPGGNGAVDFGGDDIIVPAGSSARDNSYLYTSRRLEGETGLYYYRMRYMNTNHGRFIGRDLSGFHDGLNLFAYVGDRPTNLLDPLGENGSSPVSPDPTDLTHGIERCRQGDDCPTLLEKARRWMGAINQRIGEMNEDKMKLVEKCARGGQVYYNGQWRKACDALKTHGQQIIDAMANLSECVRFYMYHEPPCDPKNRPRIKIPTFVDLPEPVQRIIEGGDLTGRGTSVKNVCPKPQIPTPPHLIDPENYSPWHEWSPVETVVVGAGVIGLAVVAWPVVAAEGVAEATGLTLIGVGGVTW